MRNIFAGSTRKKMTFVNDDYLLQNLLVIGGDAHYADQNSMIRTVLI